MRKFQKPETRFKRKGWKKILVERKKAKKVSTVRRVPSAVMPRASVAVVQSGGPSRNLASTCAQQVHTGAHLCNLVTTG